ncbi:MAG: chromate transporter [Patescibacteria group bacterium]
MGVLWSLFTAFFTIGALAFGGGYTMIPLIERVVITRHAWLTMPQFLDVVAIAEMTPGPIAVNTATFVGYQVAGWPGAAAATMGVVMPSLIIALLLAGVFYRYRALPGVQGAAFGLRLAVVALIASAAVAVGRSALLTWRDAAVAGAVVALIRGVKVHPLLVVALAALAGAVSYLLGF